MRYSMSYSAHRMAKERSAETGIDWLVVKDKKRGALLGWDNGSGYAQTVEAPLQFTPGHTRLEGLTVVARYHRGICGD